MSDTNIEGIIIKDSNPGEEGEISKLVLTTFAAQVPEEFTEEAVNTFVQVVSPEAIAERLSNEDSYFANAWDNETLVGTIGVRDGNHIFLLFVDVNYQRRGIARALVGHAAARIKNRYHVRDLFVHTTRCAIPVFEHLRFRPAGKETTQEAIPSTPMRKNI